MKLGAVGLAAVIFAPCHFAGIGLQVAPANVVMHAKFGPTQAAKRILRAQMTLKGENAATLAEKLTAMGIQETEKNVANKIARGGFSGAFFLQCLAAIGVSTLRLDE